MSTAETDRVVVITGANNGIRYHILSSLLDDGYRVAGLDIAGEDIRTRQGTTPD